MSKRYRVINPLLSTRKSADKKSPEYHEFISWKAGDLMTSWPKHAGIEEWLKGGHIVEVGDGED